MPSRRGHFCTTLSFCCIRSSSAVLYGLADCSCLYNKGREPWLNIMSDDSFSPMDIDDDLGLGPSSSSSSSSPRRRKSRKRRQAQKGRRTQRSKRARVSLPAAVDAGTSASSRFQPQGRKRSRVDAIMRGIFPTEEAAVLYDRYVDMGTRLLARRDDAFAFTPPRLVTPGEYVPGASGSTTSPAQSLSVAINRVVDETDNVSRPTKRVRSGSEEVDDEDEYHVGASRENPATVPIKYREQGISLTGVTDANRCVLYGTHLVDATGHGWMTYFDQTCRHLRTERERCQRAMRSVSMAEFILDPNTHQVDTPGDLRFRAVQEQLDSFGVVRSPDQRTFHDAMFNATLPLIYGDSWEECSAAVMRLRKIIKVEQEALILAPRRWGKTWAVGMFVASLLLHVPGIKVAVFSPTGRQSGFLKDIILDFVCRARTGRRRIVRDKNEELYVAQHPLPAGKGQHSALAKEWASSPLTSKVHFLPGTVVGTFLRVCARYFVEGVTTEIGHLCRDTPLNLCVGIAPCWSSLYCQARRMRVLCVVSFLFLLLQVSQALLCGNGVGPSMDTEGGCRCTWPYTCDATECEVGGVRCMITYPKADTSIDSNRTVTQHICSGHGFFSRYYGRCMCDFGWETTNNGVSGTQTKHGFYECNIRSTEQGANGPSYPWSTGAVTFSEDAQCDCSMRWTRYAHRTVLYDSSLIRMWGVHVDVLNASSVAVAEQIARQLCYLHYDCLATTIASTSLSEYLYTVKFWAHGTGSIVWTSRLGNSVSTTAYRINRYAWSQSGSTAGCDATTTVDRSHLASTQLALYHATNTGSPTSSTGQNWQHAHFYEYFHRHPELITPYSTCYRAQPATGSQCQYPLCPPLRVGVDVAVTGSHEPCSGNGYCGVPLSHAPVLSRTDQSARVVCTCDVGFSFYTNGDPAYENACQVSNIGQCRDGLPCADASCCNDRGTCELAIDKYESDVSVHCDCGLGIRFHEWTGKFCDTSVCNLALSPSSSCVSTVHGACVQSPNKQDYHCACTYTKESSSAYASSVRVWNATLNTEAVYDEDDANCDATLSASQRFMCYEPLSSTATEPKQGSFECNKRGHCVQVDCTGFDTPETCRSLPQACTWTFTNATFGTCGPWISGTTWTCACFRGWSSNPNWYHGKALGRLDMPEHCSVSSVDCGACNYELGICAKDARGDAVCLCYTDNAGNVMAEGGACHVPLYNETDCIPSYGGTGNAVTFTCACAVNDGPYCNLTCPDVGGVNCDAHDCTPTGSGSCGSAVVNATTCTCSCNDNDVSPSHSVLTSDGYCENPCNGHGIYGFDSSVWKCECVYGSLSVYNGKSTGYTGTSCDVFTCHGSSTWDPTLGSIGECVCSIGHSGSDCSSCLSGYYKDGNGDCVECPDCANGPHAVPSTCESNGSCACPPEYPTELSVVCAVGACVNTTGGNCNGTWGTCNHYDVDQSSPVCDCEPWAYGLVSFGGKHDGDNWWNDCTFDSNGTCSSHGYALSSGSDSECHCDDGFHGNACEFYDDDNSCSATEEWDPATGACQCLFNYFGATCNISCQTQYCNNVTASCLDMASGSDLLTCNCPDHVTVDGQQCAVTYRNQFCNGEGDRPTGGVYGTCDCDQGFLQPDCALTCRTSLCNDHGTCVSGDQVGDLNCTCDDDWITSHCDMHRCSGNGVIVGIGETCNCDNGWVGSTCCQHATDCNGRASVVVSGGECTCDCPLGTEQPHCTHPTNESASNHDVHDILDLTTAIPSSYVHASDVVWIAVVSAVGAVLIGIAVVSIIYLRRRLKLRHKINGTSPPPKSIAHEGGVGGVLRRAQGAFRRRLRSNKKS